MKNDATRLIPEVLQDAVIVLVPGVMGSTLRFRGEGRYGEPVDEIVWGQSVSATADLLASHPVRLASPELRADQIIEWIAYGPKRKPVYGPLIDFCKSDIGLGLKENVNFFPFAYDWRADNRETAQRLAEFIRRVDPEERREVYLIAHSMGGMVCRLMVLSNASIASRTRLLFQLASPMHGSASAFDSLRRHPRFHWFLDTLWGFSHHLHPDQRAQLMSTLSQFASLYQLLPPAAVTTLLKEDDGTQYSALHRDAWPGNLHSFLDAAEEVHRLLAKPIDPPIRCVYAIEHPTPWMYLVTREWQIKAERRIEAAGDGTVTCASAYAGSETGDRHPVSGGGTQHNELPSNASVHRLLREALAE